MIKCQCIVSNNNIVVILTDSLKTLNSILVGNYLIRHNMYVDAGFAAYFDF